MPVALRSRTKVVLVVALVLLAAIAALVVGFGRWRAAGADRGVPDPGGRRLTSITDIAPQMLPTEASNVTTSVVKFQWGAGGCDGGPAGWIDAEVDQTFTARSGASAAVIQQVTAQMRQLGWQLTANSPGGSASQDAQSGPIPMTGPTDNRTYEPVEASPYGEVAVLMPALSDGAGRWELDVSVEPAVNPDHSC